MSLNLPSPVAAQSSLDAISDELSKRVDQREHDGKRYFVKSPEIKMQWVTRILKGDPHRAFRREVALLRAFAERGAAVPPILAGDDTHVLLADCGESLRILVRQGRATEEVFMAAGRALAELHALGLAHGRPLKRDICWDGQRITFIDLEAGAQLAARPRDKARDLFVLLHSIMRFEDDALAHAVIDGYRSVDKDDIWHETRKRSRGLWWLEWLVAPVIHLHRRQGKSLSEFIALARTRRLLADASE